MPFCKECGAELNERTKFCPECGTPVKAAIQTPKTEEPGQDEYKTQIRVKEQIYGVVNLENLPAGHVIDERYEIKEKLGQGGFGAVYLAYDRVMGIDKALKIIPEAISSDKEAMFDLQKEARTMIALNHPNIVRVYDFHNSGNIKYIDMEYVDGKTLSEIKLEYPDKRVPEDRVKELAIKIAEGMAYAHENNVLHKDIKPQNINVNSKSEIKIMDFGIAETFRSSQSRLKETSRSGTIAYMSPEQLEGRDVGKESDIWSFGIMMYELLTGRQLYTGNSFTDLLTQIERRPFTPVRELSKQMNELLSECLQKSYKNRVKNFGKVLEYLIEEGLYTIKFDEIDTDYSIADAKLKEAKIINNLLQQASRSFKNKNYLDAVRKYEEILKLDKDNAIVKAKLQEAIIKQEEINEQYRLANIEKQISNNKNPKISKQNNKSDPIDNYKRNRTIVIIFILILICAIIATSYFSKVEFLIILLWLFETKLGLIVILFAFLSVFAIMFNDESIGITFGLILYFMLFSGIIILITCLLAVFVFHSTWDKGFDIGLKINIGVTSLMIFGACNDLND